MKKLILAGATLGLLVVLAGPAAADCGSISLSNIPSTGGLAGDGGDPGVPSPAMPGAMSSFLDSGPTAAPTRPNLDDPNFGAHVYADYGYPPAPSSYDLGCKPTPESAMVGIDTTLGGWFQGGATTVLAVVNTLHRKVSPPDLSFMDPMILKASAVVKTALFTPWLALSIVALGVGIIISARNHANARAVEGMVWALAVLALAVGLLAAPVTAGKAFDRLSADTIGALNNGIAGTSSDPSTARAGTLVNADLYQHWLRSELGDPGSTVAKKYGSRILDATTYSRVERAAINSDPKAGEDIDKAKESEFTDAAKAIKKESPAAYRTLQGKEKNRAGSSAIAVIATALTVPFMAMADLLVLFSLLIVRIAVVIFPAVAVIAMHRKGSHLGKGVLTVVAAALVNSVIFSIGAGLDTLAVGSLLTPKLGIDAWFAIGVCGLLTIVLWAMFKPFRSLTSLGHASDPISAGAGVWHGAKAKGKGAAKFAATAAATGGTAGVVGAAVIEHEERKQEEKTEVPTRPEAYSRPSETYARPITPADRPARENPPPWIHRYPHATHKPRAAEPLPEPVDGRFVYPKTEGPAEENAPAWPVANRPLINRREDKTND